VASAKLQAAVDQAAMMPRQKAAMSSVPSGSLAKAEAAAQQQQQTQ